MRIAVLMSGGVDSTVAAHLLKEQGHDVVGVHMLHLDDQDVLAVKDAAKKIGVKLFRIDIREEFRKKVIGYFLSEYKKGRTPNPCYFCNRWIKFGLLFEKLREMGYETIASGHYARVQNGKLYKAKDKKKDQSYFLSSLPREILTKVIFPLSEITKDLVRELATNLNLRVKEESQDVCFLKNKNLKAFLQENGLKGEGYFVNKKGEVLGNHDGYFSFTIGQRRGLGISLGKRVYVVDIIARENKVVLGSKTDVMSSGMIVENLNFLEDLPEKFDASVKIRSNFKEQRCTVHIGDGKAFVSFAQKAFAVTPGQIAVFYWDDQVILSGVIEKGIK